MDFLSMPTLVALVVRENLDSLVDLLGGVDY